MKALFCARFSRKTLKIPALIYLNPLIKIYQKPVLLAKRGRKIKYEGGVQRTPPFGLDLIALVGRFPQGIRLRANRLICIWASSGPVSWGVVTGPELTLFYSHSSGQFPGAARRVLPRFSAEKIIARPSVGSLSTHLFSPFSSCLFYPRGFSIGDLVPCGEPVFDTNIIASTYELVKS